MTRITVTMAEYVSEYSRGKAEHIDPTLLSPKNPALFKGVLFMLTTEAATITNSCHHQK